MRLPRSGAQILVALVAVAVGSATVLTACGPQPDENTVAKMLPANTEAILTAAVNPSVKQKANLLGLSRHLPKSVQANDAAKVQDKMLNELFNDSELNYANDVKPWLGTEVAVAVFPSYDRQGVPASALFVNVKNEKKAKLSLDKLKLSDKNYRFINGYLVLLDESDVKDHKADALFLDLQQVVNKKAPSLANSERYKASLASLHGEHLLLGWFDLPAIFDTATEGKTLEDNMFITKDDIKKVGEGIDEIGALSLELYATTSAVSLEVVTEKLPKDMGKGGDSARMNELAADTLGALGFADISATINKFVDAAEKPETQKDISSYGSLFGSYLGLAASGSRDVIDAKSRAALRDLAGSLTGDAVIAVPATDNKDDVKYGAVAKSIDATKTKKAVVALGDSLKDDGVTYKTSTANGLSTFEFTPPVDQSSYSMETFNPADYPSDGVAESYGLRSMPMAAEAPTPVATVFVAVSADRLAIASSLDYAKELAKGTETKLSGSSYDKAFRSEGVSSIDSRLFLNLDGIINLSRNSIKDDVTGEGAKWLDALQVGGYQTWHDTNHAYFEMTLTFK